MVESETLKTARGDEVQATLFAHGGERPTILLTVLDADGSRVPTAELTLRECGEFRDKLRRLCEAGVKSL